MNRPPRPPAPPADRRPGGGRPPPPNRSHRPAAERPPRDGLRPGSGRPEAGRRPLPDRRSSVDRRPRGDRPSGPRPAAGGPPRRPGRQPFRCVRLQLRPTLNNFFFTVVSHRGRTLHATSCGRRTGRGPRRAAPLATEQTARALGRRLRAVRLPWVVVELRGLLGPRSRAALRGLASAGLRLQQLDLRTPLAHNGLRPAADRRV